MAILNQGRLAAQGRSSELSSRQGVQLDVDGDAAAIESLVKLARELDQDALIAPGGTHIELAIADEETERQFPARVVEFGLRLNRYARQVESLEDVFHRLVGGSDSTEADQ